MTDTDLTVDLDDYAKILKELNEEIEIYGSERKSLNELTEILRRLHESNLTVFEGVEETVDYGTSILQDLRDLGLPEALTRIGSRYEEHQQSLKSVRDIMQQIVHEQRRSALEMLQNAQHNKQALESYAESVKTASVAHETGQQRLTQQLDSLASDLQTIKTTLATNEKQVRMLKTLMIIALVFILAVGSLSVTL